MPHPFFAYIHHPVYQFFLTLALAILALLGTIYHLPLFFGVDLLFGSIAALLAVVWLGTWAGIIVATAGAAYTITLWDHPYALLIFILEIAVVGGLRTRAQRRGRPLPPLALSDALYWFCLGIPLAVVSYRFGLGMEWAQVALVALKQTLNGILNAALVSMILLSIALLRQPHGGIRIADLNFAVLLTAMLVPGVLISTWDNHRQVAYLEQRLWQRLQLFARVTMQEFSKTDPDRTSANLIAPGALVQLLDATLLDDERLEIRSVLAAALSTPTDGILRLQLPPISSMYPSRMERYRAARYELAVPHLSDRALLVSVRAVPMINKTQHDVLWSLLLLNLLTLLALGVAQTGSRHLARLLLQLTTSARTLPVAIRDQVAWIAPPPNPFAEMNQLTATLELIGTALTKNFQQRDNQRANFRAFFNSLTDMVFITTLEGNILDLNPMVTQKLGYLPVELLGRCILDLHPPALRKEAEINVQMLCAGTSKGCALPLVTKTGEQIPTTAQVWRGQWNGSECFFSISKDLTDEFAVREALRQERELFSIGPVLTITWEITDGWPIRHVSNNVNHLLGYNPAEMMHPDFHYADLIHPEDAQAVFDEVQWYFKYRRDSFEQSYRLRLFNGDYRWFYDFTKVVRNSHGEVTEMRGYLFDQTHLKETQLALTRKRQQLLNVIDGSRLGTWEWNITTGELTINQYWAAICGYTVAELTPISYATWQRLIQADDLAACEQHLRRHLADPNVRYVYELRMRHKDGHWVWVRTEGSVVHRDADGQPLIMAGTHTDITARKMTEMELRRRELLDRLLVELATELVNLPPQMSDFDAVIERALARFGRHVDRTFFCQVDDTTATLTKTLEWTAADVAPIRAACQQLELTRFPTLLRFLQRNEPLVVAQFNQLAPQLAAECALLVAPNAQSLLLMPVAAANHLIGVIGLEAVRLPHHWSNNKIEFLRVYSNLLASTFQRQHSFASLRDSVVRYDLLAQQTRSVAWEVNANGFFTYLSPLVESVLGYRPEELVGSHHFYDLAPDSERKTLKDQALAIFARNGLFRDLVNQACHRDGRRIWLLTNGQPFFDSSGTLLGYRGADQDVTLRQNAIAQLEASESRFRVVFDHAPLGIGIPDAQRRFIYINHAYARLLGRDRESLLGKCIDDMIHPEDRPAIAQLFSELTSGVRDSYQINRRYLRPNGEVVWGDVRVTLTPNPADATPLPVVMVEDITERIAAQERNQQLQIELEATRERATIGHLASGIAHDFNNLLGVIDANLGYLGTAVQETDDPEIAEVLDETQSALGHAKVITAGMLSLSRAGGMPCEPIDLRQVFDELIAILRHLLPRCVDARFEVPADLSATSNAAFLQAALLNLVLNARDAMPDGGSLTVTASAVATAPKQPPRLGTAPLAAHVAITITDSGQGIRPATLERIFEPLFSTKAKQRGHGLGLFMVQEFVTRSGAALEVDSEVGVGTTFRLLLPCASELPPEDDEEPNEAQLTLAQLKIERVLLVDDDALVREAIGRLLTIQGWRFSTAAHGADALKILTADPDFDLVLSDIAMPVLDGFSLFETLARERPQLPVILMSGQDLKPECHIDCQLHHAHCPSILRKPLDMQQVLRTIQLLSQDAALRCQPNCVFKQALK
jgi:PAS domain S-box-containing protein